MEQTALSTGSQLEEGEAFQPSSKWNGSRTGYVFKLGGQGLGYYLDKPSRQPSSTNGMQAKAKPAALAKSSSIVKGIKPQGGVSKQQKKPGWLLRTSIVDCSYRKKAVFPV
jgi:hypothetical protein